MCSSEFLADWTISLPLVVFHCAEGLREKSKQGFTGHSALLREKSISSLHVGVFPGVLLWCRLVHVLWFTVHLCGSDEAHGAVVPGVNSLAQSLSANPHISSSLIHPDLSGNTFRGDDMQVRNTRTHTHTHTHTNTHTLAITLSRWIQICIKNGVRCCHDMSLCF